jgi:hypothetical protein
MAQMLLVVPNDLWQYRISRTAQQIFNTVGLVAPLTLLVPALLFNSLKHKGYATRRVR